MNLNTTLKMHFYGHTSLLLESPTEAIAFHPNWSPRNLFLKRTPVSPPGKEAISKVSAIVVSSGAYEHCDLFSFKYFDSKPVVFVPRGLSPFISKYIQNAVIELLPDVQTPHGNFTIEGKRTTQVGNALRPFRGSAPANISLEWQGKHFVFLLHPPTDESLAEWHKKKIDFLFLSLNDTPSLFSLKENFLSKGNLSSNLDRTLAPLSHAEKIIPVGWGGFETSPSKTLETFKQTLTDRGCFEKLHVIPIGESITL